MVEDIEHTRTKVKSPQTNGTCERVHETVFNELYRVALRRRIHTTIVELQQDLDARLAEYNDVRPHQGRWCYGKTADADVGKGEDAAGKLTIGQDGGSDAAVVTG